jgi:phospholipase A2
MPQYKNLVFLLLVHGSLWCETEVLIENPTPRGIWGASYYKSTSKVERFGEPIFIPAENEVRFPHPPLKLLVTRAFAYDINKDLLKPEMSNKEFSALSSILFGTLQGNNFRVGIKDGRTKIYNWRELNITKPFRETVAPITGAIKDTVQDWRVGKSKAVEQNPFKDRVAKVRIGNELCPGEKEFLKKRKAFIQTKLNTMLGRSVPANGVPVIAYVASGGGYRAMLWTAGALVGFDAIGLNDVTTYCVGLSGGAWGLGQWFTSGLQPRQFREQLYKKADLGLKPTTAQLGLINDAFSTKRAYDEPVTLVDLWGSLLANVFFSDKGDDRQMVHMSDQVQRIADGKWPMPIYTAIRAEWAAEKDSWYEFTPFEIGATWLNVWVPSWAFGRKFVNGSSTDDAPEQSFGFLLGIFGSAFAARYEQIYETMKSGLPDFMKNIIELAVSDKTAEQRFSRGEVFNFSVGLNQSPLREQKMLGFVDAGSWPGFNLPYQAISGERRARKADIIIILDASGGQISDGPELRHVAHYASSHNLKFPVINYSGLGSRAMTIFKDENDPEVPMVIYMPRVVDKSLVAQYKNDPQFGRMASSYEKFDVEECIAQDFCQTTKMQYAQSNAKQWSELAEFNISNPTIAKQLKEAIGWKSAQLAGKAG